MPVVELGPLCQHPDGCPRARLRYRGYCDEHGPATPPLPPTRCNHPMRCYCGADTCVPELPPAACELPHPEQVLRDMRARRALRLVSS